MIPEKIVSEAVKSITKTYPLSREEARKAFVDAAGSDRKFLSRLDHGHEGFEKWKEYKDILKRVKKKTYYSKRKYEDIGEVEKESLLNGLFKSGNEKDSKKLLSIHKSSEERLEDYPEFYKKVFDVTGKPNSVLDLSAGLNAFSMPWMLSHISRPFKYVSTDVKDVNLVGKYLSFESERSKITAVSEEFDVLEMSGRSFGEVDVCLMLKLIPVIERRRRGGGKAILEWAKDSLHPKWLVISLSKVSLVKGENIERREMKLVSRLLEESNISVKAKIEFDKEIVLVAKLG